jgi:hypothetical protein
MLERRLKTIDLLGIITFSAIIPPRRSA